MEFASIVDAFTEIFFEGIAYAQEKQWIPIKDMKPKKIDKTYICTVMAGEQLIVKECKYLGGNKWLPMYGGNLGNVIAWMPRPEPYRLPRR